jgi:glucose/arabinose dehydrogenase
MSSSRLTRRSILALALAVTALSSCGASSSRTGSEAPAPASTLASGSKGRKVALKQIGKFDAPVYATAAPGVPNLLFVVQQGGKVIVLRKGHRVAKPFLDISGLVLSEEERGLLSMAFPPNYKTSGLFYVYYTDNDGNVNVDEFRRRSATRAAPGSRRPVIEIPHPVNANHNGGQLQFVGDLLYFGTGDGGSGGDPPNNAQNKESLLGKLLRIDPRASGGNPYTVPGSNPFVGQPGRDEIYSYGLRNPFRFSFDTVSAAAPRIVIGDVGQNQIEEIDYTTLAGAAGANFGWDAFEGNSAYTEENSGTRDPGGTVKPIFDYSHDRGGGSCSVTGGYVVADPNLRSLYKRYVYADLCEGKLRSLVPTLGGARKERPIGLSVANPSSFGEDGRGHLYVASLDGPVYRVVPK